MDDLCLSVWTNGDDWVIAESEDQAMEYWLLTYGEDADDHDDMGWWKEPDDAELAINDESQDATRPIVKTMREWIEADGPGFLASLHY
jgi:hypothetical protein